MTKAEAEKLSRSEEEELLDVLLELDLREARKYGSRLFPDETVQYPDGSIFYSRHLYPKHMEFFKAGAKYRERTFMAGNRVGKTVCGAFELSLHTTGDYPDWWEGRRFKTKTSNWAAGKTNETTRDIIQKELFGEPVRVEGGRKGFTGTGIVPGELIGPVTWKQGVSDLADTVKVNHVKTGDWSTIGLKSYQQGRDAFEGTAKHAIWNDEEPPADIYGECLIRTATTGGIMMLTYTPLEGMTETVMQFLPKEMRPDLES